MNKTSSLAAAAKAAASKAAQTAEAAPSTRRRKGGTKSREDTRLIAGHFPADYARKIRMLAADKDCTIQSLLDEALRDLFIKNAI